MLASSSRTSREPTQRHDQVNGLGSQQGALQPSFRDTRCTYGGGRLPPGLRIPASWGPLTDCHDDEEQQSQHEKDESEAWQDFNDVVPLSQGMWRAPAFGSRL